MRLFAALASTNAGRRNCKEKKKKKRREREGEGGEKLRENPIENK